jgi:ubiquinone/menaquinone biosynthesis C-methylase UbiE
VDQGQRAVLREYGRLARHYDRRWSRYVAASNAATAARIALRPGEGLLDLGCGTGALLLRLALDCPGARLAGADPSAEMLAVARHRLPPAVPLVRAFAERLPFAEGSFDVVASVSAFHYFRDPAGALAEMRRVLRPAGRLVLTDWCDDFLACRLCDLLLRWLNAAHARAYGGGECREMLAAAGFGGGRVERYKISWLWGLMTATAARPPSPAGG